VNDEDLNWLILLFEQFDWFSELEDRFVNDPG